MNYPPSARLCCFEDGAAISPNSHVGPYILSDGLRRALDDNTGTEVPHGHWVLEVAVELF